MKRFLILVTIFCLPIGVVPTAYADVLTFSCGNNATYSVTMPAGVATDGSKCSGPLEIDKSVKIIGKNAFSFSKITSVKLTNSVVAIEANGLSYLRLETIDLGDSIETLGFEAFRGTRVSSIKLPNNLKEIGESALADTSFDQITIPNSVVVIGRTAFAREDSQIPLSAIVIPDSVKSLGFAAFVRSGLRNITIGKGIETIPASAFEGNKITDVTIPVNIRNIQAFAFRGNPIKTVKFGDSVRLIDSEAFARTQLASIVLPLSLTDIGSMAFSNIPTLKEIDFPDKFNPMFTAANVPTVGDIFEGSYAISRILYCGIATGFYVTPTCEGSRKAAYERVGLTESKKNTEGTSNSATPDSTSTGAVDQDVEDPILEKRKQLIENLTKKLESLKLKKPDLKQVILKSQSSLSMIKLSPKLIGDSAFQQSVSLIEKQIQMYEKMLTITCQKGKTSKTITSIKPSCPKGYKKK